LKTGFCFDEPEPDFLPSGNTLSIEETITIAIDDLEFRYGTIALIPGSPNTSELDFEIENDQIRPEFDVLNHTFQKILKKKNVNILIQAEFSGET